MKARAEEPVALIEICALEDIPRLGSRVVIGRQGAVALFRTADDQVFALDDRCPHKGGPLSQGIVHGERVTCPLHNWVIGLADGEAQGVDTGCVARHAVEMREGRVWLERAALFAAVPGSGLPAARVHETAAGAPAHSAPRVAHEA